MELLFIKFQQSTAAAVGKDCFCTAAAATKYMIDIVHIAKP
jgi:hypothetical protein